MIFNKNVDIDMREAMNSMFELFGMNVLYIRANTKTRCKCYSPLHSDGKIDCPYCSGSGRLNTIECLPVVYQNKKDSGKVGLNELGESELKRLELYFDYTRAPSVNDKVIIVGFDKVGIPIDVRRVYNIETVEDVRGDEGRVEIYRVLAESLPTEISLTQRRLNLVPINVKRKIIEGRRYSWSQGLI